jgi:phosphoribosylanthranilate isomerase
MTWVKVCGLTNPADVATAVAAGADAVGFINIESSPRYVTRARAFELAANAAALAIMLTVDIDPREAAAMIRTTPIDGLQPYGRDAAATARAVVDAGGVALYPQPAGSAIESVPGIPLIDTPAGEALGGTGRSFDWDLLSDLSGRFVLAGGLGPDNVAAAIEAVHPWGVDASSRLEQSPGKKDPSMVASFVKKAKES